MERFLRLVLFVSLTSMLLFGCGDNSIPKQKNEKLGVELPINVHTDWEIEDLGYAKAVIYYSDPYKKGYPPYVEGKSPDIEKVICINDTGLFNDDRLIGEYVTGLNEYRAPSPMPVPSDKYDRSSLHSIGTLSILKEADTGKYIVQAVSYRIDQMADDNIQYLLQDGRNPITFAITEGPFNLGYVYIARSYIADFKVSGDKISATLYNQNNQSEINAYLDMKYHSGNNTLEIENIKFVKKDPGIIAFSDFGLRKHHDILKKYSSSSEIKEILTGLIQMKIDQIKAVCPADVSGYRNLMLNFKHTEIIPGTRDTSKPILPTFPKEEPSSVRSVK